MANQKPDIEVTVDASQAKAEFGSIGASAKTMADVVTRETTKAGRSVDNLGAASAGAGEKLDRSTKAYVNSLQRVIAAEQAGGRSTVEYQRLLAQQRGVPEAVYKPLIDQLEAVKKAQEAAKAGLNGVRTDLSATGLTAKQTAAALRQVPAQFTDIVVSLQGGTNPLTVFLQQGGQLKDVFGSAGAAAQALGRYVLGLINPFTVLVGAIAAVVAGYALGTKETDEFNKALITTGRYAGLTTDQLRELSGEIANNAKVTKGAAASAVTLAVNAGLTGREIGLAADAAVRLDKSLGIGLDKTIEQFKSLGDEPLKAALKLNETTKFLTASTYEQIRALEQQGRTVEAARVAQEAYANSVTSRTGEVVNNLGYIEAAYIGIKDALKGLFDLSKEFGRDAVPATAESVLTATRQRIAELEQKRAPGRGIFSGLSDAQKAELALLQAIEAAQAAAAKSAQDRAKAEFEAAKAVELKARFDQRGLQYLDDEAKKRNTLLKLQGQLNEEVRAGAITQKQANDQLNAARISLDKKDGGESKAAARLELEAKRIESALSEQLRAYTVNEKGVEAVRAAGLLGESEYYQARRSFLELTTEAQKRAIDEEIALRQKTNLGSTTGQIENEKKIVELVKKRNELLIQAGGSQFVLGIQQQAALDNLARSFLQARQAAESYLATAERGFAREQQGFGRGDRARGELQGISAVEERFIQRRRELENTFTLATLAGPPTPEIAAKYANDLAVLEEFQTKEVDAFRRAYERKTQAERDWRNGVTRGLENYTDSVANTAASVENLLTNAFKGAEDAFVEFARTGELSFSKLADSIVSDLIRIGVQKRITGPLAEAFLGNSSGGGDASIISAIRSFLPFASGGVVNSPSLSNYSNQVLDKPTFFAFAKGGVAGEAGPEAIMPLTRAPDGNLGVRAVGGGGGTTINIIESQDKAGSVDRRNTAGGETIDVYVARIAKQAVAADVRSGRGEVASAMQSTFGVNRVAGAY